MKNLILLSVFIFLTFNALGQNDTQAPVLQCKNIVTSNITFARNAVSWVADYIKYAEDNLTPAKELVFGIRKKGSGTGFPLDAKGMPVQFLVFECKEMGANEVEVWGKDKAGNANFCTSITVVMDPYKTLCDLSIPRTHNICVQNYCGGEFDEITLQLTNHYATDPLFVRTINLNLDTCTAAEVPTYYGSNFSLVKDENPLNGVSTYDLVVISKHILGLEMLGSPYLLIAADANRSNSVTTLDIVELRKLILGIYSKLPHNTSWRFVRKDYVFPSIFNPFVPNMKMFPDSILLDSLKSEVAFWGIKIGDVNCTAKSKFTGDNPQDRSAPLPFSLPDLSLSAGETIDVPIFLGENGTWPGLQFELAFDPQLLDIQSLTSSTLSNFSSDNYHISDEGILRVSWSEAAATTDKAAAVLNLRLRARAPLRLRDAITLHDDAFPSEMYSAEAIHPLQLHFRPASNGAIAIGQPWPNPATEGFNIDLNTTEPTTYHLQIVDPSGRVLYRASEIAPAGESLLQVPAHALPVAGVYGWRLSAGDVLKSGKLVLEPKR